MKEERKGAVEISEVIRGYTRMMRITSALNTRRVFEAWDKVTGAGEHSLRKFFRDGVLHVTLDSSVLRMALQLQKASIINDMNAVLAADDLFTPDDPKAGFVKELNLK